MPFGLDKIVLAGAILYLVFSNRAEEFFLLFRDELCILLLIAVFSCLITVIHNGFSLEGLIVYDIFLLIEVLLVPYCILSFFSSKWECNIQELIVINAIVAGGISVLLLLNPAWADMMKNQILRIPDLLTENFSFRGYGFSDGLLFAFPVIQGFCAGFIVCGMVERKPLYYLGLIPLVISILVNARSGVVPLIVAIIVLAFYYPIKNVMKVAIPVAIMLLLVSFFYEPNGESQLSESIEWGLSIFQIIGDYFSGEEAQNMDALTGTMVQFPHSLSAWIMGEGVNLFGNSMFKDYNESDIGICIRTVYGGILYMFFWIVLWIFMFKRLFEVNKQMALILFVSLLYLNWKSDFFVINASCRFFFMIYVCCIMNPSFMKVRDLQNVSIN